MSDTNNISGGLGFTGALFLVFLILKLTHYISWSWWWVTAPLWGPVAVVIMAVLTTLFAAFIITIFKK